MGLISEAVHGIIKLAKFLFKLIYTGIKCTIYVITDAYTTFKQRKKDEAKADVNRKAHLNEEIF